tara:strand:+ start:798 stop:980 length:183 start_codon:yes stop_codon:yes gene_type:complete
MNNISKGEALISLVSEETTVYSGELMENSEFVAEAKRLIKDKLTFNTVKDNLVEWVNNNY